MLSINGIYDGEKITFLEKVKFKSPKRVIITFLDEENDDDIQKNIYTISERNSSFDFLKEPEEDIYTDKDLKIKYSQ